MAMRKVQFTYFNQTAKHINLYRGSLRDHVGNFEPNSMISFEVELQDNQAIFIKQWTENTMLIMAVDKQSGDTGTPINKIDETIANEDFYGCI